MIVICNKTMSIIPFEKSFASHEKSQFWSEKNIDENGIKINPKYVFKSTGKKYHFDCFCGHTFCVSLYSIVAGTWCAYCSNKKVCGKESCETCFDKSIAKHPISKRWDYEKNGEIKPYMVLLRSNKKYYYKCCICLHSSHFAIQTKTTENSCSFCKNKRCDEINCNICLNRSFASHEKAHYWSNKNGNIKPRDIALHSNDTYWFDCPDCNHSFDSIINNVAKGQWCPYCCVPTKKICNNDNCVFCYNKTFASHEKSKFWSDNNVDIKPIHILLGGHAKYWFGCPDCKHTFEQYISVIISGSFCNFCSGKVICKKDDCIKCYNNSFASHEKSKYWNYRKNADKPIDNFVCCKQKRWFICDKNPIHSFQIYLYSIVAGSWCPYCVNKSESKLYEKIQPFYPTILAQFKQEWCKKISYLPFDFVIPEYKIIIELDGPQHFQQISNWSSPEEQFENDKYKENCANDNWYSVIRVLQEDVFYDTYDWVKELCETIEEIKNGDEVANVYLCKNGEYDAF